MAAKRATTVILAVEPLCRRWRSSLLDEYIIDVRHCVGLSEEPGERQQHLVLIFAIGLP
jgi:hypothetical protein